MEIKLQPAHARNLAKILDYFDLGEVPVLVSVNEAKQKLVYKNSTDLENMSYKEKSIVTKVDEAIINSIPNVIKEFQEQELWYERFNEAINKTLGKSDGTYFLALMAAFSANTRLEQNLSMATRAYHALKGDMTANKDLLLQYMDTVDNRYKGNKKYANKVGSNNPYASLRYFNFIKTHSTLDNHLHMANYATKYYINQNGNVQPSDFAEIITKNFEESGDIGKGGFTTGNKILNFALNLIAPGTPIKYDWWPVTIDTWMIYFFYPYLKATRGKAYNPDDAKAKKKERLAIMGNYKKYTYLAKIVQEQAAKFNMTPHGLQAILWAATIRKYQPNASSKDIHATLTYMINEFNRDQQELSDMIKFVDSINAALK
jgi:hypothetical protein